MRTRVNILTVVFAALLMNVNAEELKFKMQEEAFINDIPFNTAVIAVEHASGELFGFQLTMEEEEYIQDIPFDTHSIAETVIHQELIQELPAIDEEPYIDDIPFNTFEVIQSIDQK